MSLPYAEDSFFTLSLWGGIGLMLLSLLLAGVLFWFHWRWLRRRRLWLALPLSLFSFLLFIWLSPQVYYGYYLLLFDGLPLQVVIKAPPSPAHLLALITFRADASLSHHSQGLLFWALLITVLLRRRKALRSG